MVGHPAAVATLFRSLLALLVSLWAVGGFSAERPNPAGEKRIALVLGNDKYATAPLRNPVNDATAIAAKLREFDFEVVLRTNVSQREMTRAVREFGEKITPGSVALFYYAGHGMQARGKNFLIPVDAEIKSESAISIEAVDVERVLDQLTGARVSMVILDACRNNPFERSFRSGAGAGLAQIDAPAGTLIAYATAPGKTAADGEGKHGLYTQALLNAMEAPGLRIEDVFKQVRIDVLKVTASKQIPWESSSLTGDFLFRPTAVTVSDRQEQRVGSEEAATLRDAMAALQAQIAELQNRPSPASGVQGGRSDVKKPEAQDTKALREQVTRLNTEVTRLQQQRPVAGAAGPAEHTAEWAQQLARLSALGGKLDLATAMETLLDVTAPNEIAALKRFASQVSRRQYNTVLALGVDPDGFLVWGGAYNFRILPFAYETAASYCGTTGVESCKTVSLNGNLLREPLLEALKPLGRQSLEAVRAAFIASLTLPIVEAAAGLPDVAGSAGSVRPPMGYTFRKGK